jgi:hypothetical protein
MRRMILVLLLTAFSSSAMAEWVKVSNVDGGDITFYTDPSTIRKNGKLVKMWELQDYLTARTGENYLSVKIQNEYDCKNEKTRLLFLSTHSGHMGGGDLVEMNNNPGEWIPVPPASIIQALCILRLNFLQ